MIYALAFSPCFLPLSVFILKPIFTKVTPFGIESTILQHKFVRDSNCLYGQVWMGSSSLESSWFESQSLQTKFTPFAIKSTISQSNPPFPNKIHHFAIKPIISQSNPPFHNQIHHFAIKSTKLIQSSFFSVQSPILSQNNLFSQNFK